MSRLHSSTLLIFSFGTSIIIRWIFVAFTVIGGTNVEAFISRENRVANISRVISLHRVKEHMKPNLHVSNKDNNDSNNEQEEYDPRDNFGRSLRGLQSSALKSTIDTGDTIVCKRSIPNLGIYADLSYEVTSIYTQTFNDETQQIVKQQLSSLNNDDDDGITTKEVYLTLYSPQFHSEGGPVVVTPEEVGLISIRDELGNAAWLALPGFFWIFVAASFFNTYHERTGGSFGDALLGR